MDFKTGIGKSGLALAALFALAMCILSLIFHPMEIQPIQYGIALPSPDSWNIDPFFSWLINTLLIAGITVLLTIINRSFNFVRTTEPTLAALFPLMAASCPGFTEYLNTSVILCLANVICLGVIFNSYDTRNATQHLFTLGVVVGVGSMFQYAFLPMAFVYFVWALFMKVLRIKETLAFIIGILCPYWIALGTGWLRFSDIHFPSLTPLFGTAHDHYDFLMLLIGIAMAVTFGFLLALINSMKLYAGNSKVNAMNLCINILGAASVICILVDFDNIGAYVITLYMACAVQIANVNALWNPRMPWIITAVPALLYTGIFVVSMIL